MLGLKQEAQHSSHIKTISIQDKYGIESRVINKYYNA